MFDKETVSCLASPTSAAAEPPRIPQRQKLITQKQAMITNTGFGITLSKTRNKSSEDIFIKDLELNVFALKV